MTDLEARVARLEALVVRLKPEALDEAVASTSPAPTAKAPDLAEGAPPLDIHAWIDHQLKTNKVLVFAGVARPGARATMHRGWGSEEDVQINHRRAAAVCAALSSEPRLAMLQDLMHGSRTTAELIEALAFDRGQLYHHLRDLFVQAMVEQPERGRYALTSRGAWALLLAGLLAGDAPVASEIPDNEGSI